MEIPYSSWYSVIAKRRSHRSFEPKQIDDRLLAQIDSVCREFRPFPDARCVLVKEVPATLFIGAIGPYGKIKDAPVFIAFSRTGSSSSAWPTSAA